MTAEFAHVQFVTAGAGSGKTYRLTEELEAALVSGEVRAEGIIGTTFTVKAAQELKTRVRSRLIRAGHVETAESLSAALLGTVHSVCERLLTRFAFDLGLSPELAVMSEEDSRAVFSQALDECVDDRRLAAMNERARRLEQFGWQETVRAVADKARENDIALPALRQMGAKNVADFLHFCPPSDTRVNSGALLDAVHLAFTSIDTAADSTKTTANYVDNLVTSRHHLAEGQWTWATWMRLASGGRARAAKASDSSAQTVREVAGGFAACPEFHADITHYVSEIFAVAADTLERFDALKVERGLIDFLDMEQRLLHGLDHAPVRQRLAGELQLLMVDEFQDTNPMQLALFVKLAALADRVVFVGDVKQAIYAFRGSAPDLVFATLSELSARGAVLSRLERNWRSTPALLHYTNEVFSTAFADSLARDDVVLQAQRQTQTEVAAAVHWQLAGGNRDERCESLTQAIIDVVADKMPITDPDTGEVRPVSFGDIAVLARTNRQVENQARSLKDAGVPTKMSLHGLLATPEVVLAKACMRRLSDPLDTIASAEIVSLAGETAENWLAGRLEHVALGGNPATWGEDTHPVLKRLAELREESRFRSPVEVVAHVLNDIGAREIVASWGPDAIKVQQRQRNLDAFLELSVQYEKHCALQHLAATLTGFLFWLENPTSPDLDLQPVVTAGDAVHVLTYHKSKGLEWPVVICLDLESVERSSFFDVRVLAGPFDVTRPLDSRFVRFWPNIFGPRKNLALQDAFAASEEARACDVDGLAEQRRLAYVGMTRARDVLVLAMADAPLKQDSWIRALSDGDELPFAEGLESALAVEDRGELLTLPAYEPHWFHRRARASFTRERLIPSACPPLPDSAIGKVIELGARLPLTGDDVTAIGNAMHAVFAAAVTNGVPDDVSALLRAHEAAEHIESAHVETAARRLLDALDAHFRDAQVRVEWPVSHRLADGRVLHGFVDLLVELPDRLVVIDHKASPKARSAWAEEAAAYSGQLAAYRQALSASGKPVHTMLHLPVSGALVEVLLPE